MQARHYDAHHVDRRFVIGDIVRRRMQRSDAVDGQFNLSAVYSPDPFRVVAVLSEVSFIIEGFDNDKVRHTAVASDLILAVLDADAPALIQQEAGDEAALYVVQRIHAHRRLGPDEPLEFLVQWGGWRDKRSFTWQPRASLEQSASQVLSLYEAAANL